MKVVFKVLIVAFLGLATIGCGGGNTVETPSNPAATPSEDAASAAPAPPAPVGLPPQGQ